MKYNNKKYSKPKKILLFRINECWIRSKLTQQVYLDVAGSCVNFSGNLELPCPVIFVDEVDVVFWVEGKGGLQCGCCLTKRRYERLERKREARRSMDRMSTRRWMALASALDSWRGYRSFVHRFNFSWAPTYATVSHPRCSTPRTLPSWTRAACS